MPVGGGRGMRRYGMGNDTRVTRRAFAAAAAAGSTALAACGVGTGSSNAPPKASKVTGKLQWEIRMGPTYEQLAKEALPLFKERNPDIQVEYAPKANDWIEKDVAGMAAGSGPDVLTAWSRTVRPFLSKGLALNVNPLLKDLKKADLDDYIKGQWDDYQVPNSDLRWALPTYTNVCVVFYNKGLFRKAGVPEPTATWTYDDYADRAKRLTRQDGGQQVYGGYQPSNVWIRMQNQIWGFGGNAVDPKDSTKSAVHLPQTQAALQWIYDRYWRDGSWVSFKERIAGWNWWADVINGKLANVNLRLPRDLATKSPSPVRVFELFTCQAEA